MCSRYYIDPGMTEDISRVVQNIDGEDLAGTRRYPSDRCRTGHWTVRTRTGTGYMQMGDIPCQKARGLVINARVETVLDKPSFQNGILYHRLLIPAGGFYEWNSLKEKEYLYQTGFLCAVHGRVL